jgi:preprotein translocase subunit SecB
MSTLVGIYQRGGAMKESILQLRDYFITKTFVELNPGFRVDEPSIFDAEDLTIDIESNMLMYPDSKEEVFKVDLKISVKNESIKKCNLPYIFDISSIGIFGLADSCTENREKIAVINGATILFSSIRDYLAGITGHGPFPRVLLPTVDLRGLAKNEQPQPTKPVKPQREKK